MSRRSSLFVSSNFFSALRFTPASVCARAVWYVIRFEFVAGDGPSAMAAESGGAPESPVPSASGAGNSGATVPAAEILGALSCIGGGRFLPAAGASRVGTGIAGSGSGAGAAATSSPSPLKLRFLRTAEAMGERVYASGKTNWEEEKEMSDGKRCSPAS
jgi:hypothetical protein